MTLAELYDPYISGQQYSGFIKALIDYRDIDCEWSNNIDLEELDKYVFYNLSQRELYDLMTLNDKTAFDYLHAIFIANKYKLDGLYDSTTYSDKYSPIENYDRIEDSTVDVDIDAGARKVKNSNGQRTVTNSYGAHTDTDITEGTTSPFDSTSFSADNEKSKTEMQRTAYNDTATTGASEDTVNTDSYHDDNKTTTHSRIHGNIGVMRVDEMLAGQRQVVNYIFFDEILKLLCNTILKNSLWNV